MTSLLPVASSGDAMEAQARTQTKATAVPFEVAYHDQGEDDYDDADEGGPLPKLTDDPADLAPFIPADKAAVLSALRLTGVRPRPAAVLYPDEAACWCLSVVKRMSLLRPYAASRANTPIMPHWPRRAMA